MDIKDSGVGGGLLGESTYTWRLTKRTRSLLQANRSYGRGALSLVLGFRRIPNVGMHTVFLF